MLDIKELSKKSYEERCEIIREAGERIRKALKSTSGLGPLSRVSQIGFVVDTAVFLFFEVFREVKEDWGLEATPSELCAETLAGLSDKSDALKVVEERLLDTMAHIRRFKTGTPAMKEACREELKLRGIL